MVTTSFFHAYDLRGVYPGEIGEDEARRVGKAFGTHVGDEVLVGRDARKHGETVKGAFVDGVVSTGTDVLDAGTVPTPVVYYGTVELGVDASAVVTASHNPPEYTGFKFSKRGAVSMSREGGMAEVQRIYESGSFEEGDGDLTRVDIVDDYLGFVEERIELESGLDVAVNYGNGVTAEVGGEMLRRLGCDVTEVNAEIDGEFPNHLPAPTEEEAQEQLREVIDGHDLGVLFDGDGDRAGFMLPDGRYVDEDEMISVFAENCLGRAG
ncbi:MAG: phosphomannomutase/phosphoglucomutase, partial [Halobacteria archaeon]|nr:phosphomannomutase/phosphoglucomutase [Halobacteria archaeon]